MPRDPKHLALDFIDALFEADKSENRVLWAAYCELSHLDQYQNDINCAAQLVRLGRIIQELFD